MYSVENSFCDTCANYNFIKPKNPYLQHCLNWTSLRPLSIREDGNVYEVFLGPDGEQNSASIKLIFG